MSTDKDLSSKNLEELLSMKNSLELELEEATETLRELKKLKKERQAAKTTAGLIYHADRRSSVLTGSILGGMFNEAHQMTDTYYPPPLTVFANWGPDSMYCADRSDLSCCSLPTRLASGWRRRLTRSTSARRSPCSATGMMSLSTMLMTP